MTTRSSTLAVDRLVRDRVLTKPGRDWLIAAVDPFHDTDLGVTGYPDTNVAASIVQVVKQSVTIASTVGTSADWDLHIFSLPVTSALNTEAFLISDGNVLYNANTPGGLGMLNWSQGVTGSGANLGIGLVSGSLSANASYFQGNCRVIASGWEVVNTTADLYKQGQATVYRMPQPPALPVTYGLGTSSAGVLTAFYGAGSLYSLRSPPDTTAEAFLFSGTRQWAAREGAYMVPTFSTPNLPPAFDAQTGFYFPDPIPGTTYNLASAITQSGSTYSFVNEAKHTNQNTAGLFLTGLSGTSTVTLTLNVFIETFPSFEDTQLVVLAKPSPRYDLVAQEMYAECLADMPSGVMVKENGLGDWFKNAISTVSRWAAPALSAIPHPAAQAVGAGLRAANSVMSKRNPAYSAEAPLSSMAVEEYTEEERNVIRDLRRKKRRGKPLPPTPRSRV